MKNADDVIPYRRRKDLDEGHLLVEDEGMLRAEEAFDTFGGDGTV
jgi:hypothetical protein